MTSKRPRTSAAWKPFRTLPNTRTPIGLTFIFRVTPIGWSSRSRTTAPASTSVNTPAAACITWPIGPRPSAAVSRSLLARALEPLSAGGSHLVEICQHGADPTMRRRVAADVQLGEDRPDVFFHRTFGKHQLGGNRSIGLRLRDQFKHLPLP